MRLSWMSSTYQLAFVVWQGPALRRAERAGLALDWALAEVVVAFFGVDFGHDSSNPDLPVQRGPVKCDRDFAVVGDLVCFGAFIVGEEHKPACAHFFQKNEAVVGEAVRIDCAQAHHVRLDRFLEVSYLRKPILELLERVFVETLVETGVPCARRGRCGTLCARS